MTGATLKNRINLNNLFFVLALIQTAWLVWFFYTGLGGALELTVRVLSIALILQMLFMYQQEYFYKWLPPVINHIMVVVYIGICIYALIYFYFEYERIAIYSQGTYTQQDFIVGLLMFLLVMELSRLAHPVLFWPVGNYLIIYRLVSASAPIEIVAITQGSRDIPSFLHRRTPR